MSSPRLGGWCAEDAGFMTEPEKILIAGCVKGEKAAWDAFVQQYSNLVYHTIRKTLVSYSNLPRDDFIEELFQEFFADLLAENCKNLSRFRGDRGCTLANWLVVLARRLTIDFLRRQPLPTVELTETIASHEVDVREALIRQEEEDALSRAIEELEPRDQLIINLSYCQGLWPEEIASILRVSVGTFYTQKSRALAKLRDLLKKSGLV